jgi:hypothetical protein
VSVAGDHYDKDPKVKAFKESEYKFITKLDDLLTKYEKAADNKKDAVKKDVRKLVTDFLDKEIAMKKDKIAKLQARISEYEVDKNKFIDKKVDFLTSEEGQAKIHKKKECCDKKKAEKEKDKMKK